jgi:hypothetical protein
METEAIKVPTVVLEPSLERRLEKEILGYVHVT